MLHQQGYCRYASNDCGKPAHSWRSDRTLHNGTDPPWPEQQALAARQQSPEVLSPFQTVADSSVQAEVHCPPHTTSSEPNPASLTWQHSMSPMHSLIASLEERTGSEDPQLSNKVSNAPTFHHHPKASIGRYASAPVISISPGPYPLTLDSAPSFASDTLSFQTSPSLPLPDLPSSTAIPQAHHQAVTMTDDNWPLPNQIKLQLTSAPAMFAQPIGINKVISPAFQVFLLALHIVPSLPSFLPIVLHHICPVHHSSSNRVQ